ncbi:MAG: hypothetical protein ACRDVD_08335, partial [Acidimicrobiia bacterium]
MKADYALAVLSSAQAGFLGHHQVQAAGLDDEAIARRVNNGTWTRVRGNLYKVDGVDGDYK